MDFIWIRCFAHGLVSKLSVEEYLSDRLPDGSRSGDIVATVVIRDAEEILERAWLEDFVVEENIV